MMAMIDLRGVYHLFYKADNKVLALNNINLQVAPFDFVALVGPSGCGKSTILNLISGLMTAAKGEVLYDGQRVVGVNTRVGYLTQMDSLLPWRTAEENIALPLEVKGVAAGKRKAHVAEMIALMHLTGFEKSYPYELSGGMRKRVAIARTWAYEPETLLLDEPFGTLDAQMRLILQDELLSLWALRRKTVLFVTHDLGEAVALANRVVVLTRRPGTLKMMRDIPFPYPRDIFGLRFSPEYSHIHEELWTALRDEVVTGSH